MDFHNSIAHLQKMLYKGFESASESDIKWLNGVSGEFLKFFRDLHKFMVFDCAGEKNSSVLEEIFLCIRQITVCIRNLERVLSTEKRERIVLTPSRQHFLDRILWCLARIRSSVASITDNVALPDAIEDANFVIFLDTALDLLEPLTTYEEDEQNVAERNAEAHVRSKEIRAVVDSLISQTLAFVNVVLEKDKKALTAHCQRVLKECIALEEECAVDCAGETDLNRRFKAELLEVALTHLEQAVNSSLLRLVCQVFQQLAGNPVDLFRKAVRMAKQEEDEELLEKETEKFDLLLDRILQIGILGIAFSSDQVAKSILRSCLASSECLDSALIPSIFSECSHHSRLLEVHWRDEMKIFQREVQKIIDTDAFCVSIVDTLSTLLEDSGQANDPQSLEAALKQVKVLQAHLEVNKDALQVEENHIQTKNLADFHKMLAECDAALELRQAENIEIARIVKRFRILLAVLKRFQRELGGGVFEFEEPKVKEESAKEDFFQSLGINPHVSVILYKTKAPKTDSMVAQFSKLSLCRTNVSSKQPARRNLSLRKAMFRKNVTANQAESTLNLNLTQVLEDLTSLSDTFADGGPEIQEVDHKIRIKVRN
ncbi:serendipity locus protein alpha-like [Phlebotomus argentipes]|uniref:serendipity locus protein alpha-like n=1 Tax=Phlebotomus argentipes TaxID=94469 RepID=UPI00289315CA|nr:serendipity locus protein alpha-like [Phlebotomus argentipes]